MVSVEVVDQWILEYACFRRMPTVIHEINVKRVKDIWTSGVSHVRLMTTMLQMMVDNNEAEHYEDAISLVSLLYSTCDDVMSYKLYDKITSALKILVLFDKMKQNYCHAVLTASLNKFFPRSGPVHPKALEVEIERINAAKLKFRRFFLSLLMNDAKRQSYLESGLQKEYGEQFHATLKILMSVFIEKVEVYLPVPVIKKLLQEDHDGATISSLTCKPSVAMEILLDFLQGQEDLSEGQLLELVSTLHPDEHEKGEGSQGGVFQLLTHPSIESEDEMKDSNRMVDSQSIMGQSEHADVIDTDLENSNSCPKSKRSPEHSDKLQESTGLRSWQMLQKDHGRNSCKRNKNTSAISDVTEPTITSQPSIQPRIYKQKPMSPRKKKDNIVQGLSQSLISDLNCLEHSVSCPEHVEQNTVFSPTYRNSESSRARNLDQKLRNKKHRSLTANKDNYDRRNEESSMEITDNCSRNKSSDSPHISPSSVNSEISDRDIDAGMRECSILLHNIDCENQESVSPEKISFKCCATGTREKRSCPQMNLAESSHSVVQANKFLRNNTEPSPPSSQKIGACEKPRSSSVKKRKRPDFSWVEPSWSPTKRARSKSKPSDSKFTLASDEMKSQENESVVLGGDVGLPNSGKSSSSSNPSVSLLTGKPNTKCRIHDMISNGTDRFQVTGAIRRNVVEKSPPSSPTASFHSCLSALSSPVSDSFISKITAEEVCGSNLPDLEATLCFEEGEHAEESVEKIEDSFSQADDMSHSPFKVPELAVHLKPFGVRPCIVKLKRNLLNEKWPNLFS